MLKRFIYTLVLVLCAAHLSAQSKVTSVETVAGRTWMCVWENGALNLSYSDKSKFVQSHKVCPDSLSSASFGQLWHAPDGTLRLFYTETDAYFDGRGVLKSIVCSDPAGKSPQWGSSTEIGLGVCTGAPVVTPDGSWLVPGALWGRTLIGDDPHFYGNDRNRKDSGIYQELDAQRGPLLYRSDDSGKSWTCKSGFIKVPEMVDARYNDPQLLTSPDGQIRMVLRSSGTGWTYSSLSQDNGRTWSQPERFVQNPDRKASFISLPDGRIMMVKVGKLDEFVYFLGSGLYAYMSDDLGKTWYGGLCLSQSPDADAPVAVCDGQGKISVAFNDVNDVCMALTSQEEILRGITDHEYVASDVARVIAWEKPKGKPAKEKPQWADESIRICTYNIQYRNDKMCKWEYRLSAIKGFVKAYAPDVIGSQEPYGPEVDDIVMALDGKYGWIGVNNRNESLPPFYKTAAFNPIFYRKDRVEVLEWDVIWYTPKATKRGYGADYSRFMIWARMLDKKTQQEFYIFNSHFDHKSEEAKRVSARILVQAVKDIAGDMPAILTGDFNTTETNVPYATIMESGFLDNSKLAVDDAVNHMYYSQARYKSIETVSQKDVHIDHVFYTPDRSRIESWELVIKTFGGYYGSDHLPIVVDWRLRRQ